MTFKTACAAYRAMCRESDQTPNRPNEDASEQRCDGWRLRNADGYFLADAYVRDEIICCTPTARPD